MTTATKRPYRRWTPELVQRLAHDYPLMSSDELEACYGRDNETLRATLRRHGMAQTRNRDVQIAASARGAAHRWQARRNLATGHPDALSAHAVATALGVDITTIANWVARGWIVAKRARIGKDPLYAILPRNVERFLFQRGGTLELFVQDAYRPVYEQARIQLRSKLIHGNDLLRLMLSGGDTAYFRREHGLPEPVLRNGAKNGGDWYDRTQVRAWLDANPRYHTAHTRAALD